MATKTKTHNRKLGTIKIKSFKYPWAIPETKPRSERAMEEAIHRHNVIARRRQTAEIIDQNPALITTEIIVYRVNQGVEYLKSKLNK